jgi:hypothetical protein
MNHANRFPLVLMLSCGTLGSPGSEGGDLPSAGVGPFRPLTAGELPPFAVAPFVLEDRAARYREPCVVAASDDTASPAALLYAVARVNGRDVIVRSRAADGRSFYGGAADNQTGSHPPHFPAVVLAADRPWEGDDLGGPGALRVHGEVWLYYAAADGIGLAKSSDGLSFTKTGGPVLAAEGGAGWEVTPPRAPSVAVLPDGSWRMFYGAGGSIGEARSDDGMTWTRVDGDPSTEAIDPVLAPRPRVDVASLPPGAAPPFDEASVDDPFVSWRITPAGRLHVRVLYTGYAPAVGAARPDSAIGEAARYGDSGALRRGNAPVYAVSLHEAAPALFVSGGGSMLYVHEDDGVQDRAGSYPAIAAAVAPVDVTLPAAAPFPPAP